MGLLSTLSQKFSAIRDRAEGKKEFLRDLMAAAADGKLTDREVDELTGQYKQLGLTKNDMGAVRARAYSAAFRAAREDGVVTAEEEAELSKLETFLMIPHEEIAHDKRQLARLRLLTEIQQGNPPALSVSNVVLQKGEAAFWSEPARLLEERVVGRRYEGNSQGVSFRIMKGVSYRVGSSRGQLITDRAVVPISSGELIVTSKRCVFRGDAKSFNLPYPKLLELQIYSDGVRLTDLNGKPRTLQFSQQGNADLVGATLSFAINRANG